MWTEDTLATLYAAVWLGFFGFVLYILLRQIWDDPRRAFRSALRDPLGPLAGALLYGGVFTFLYWIVFSHSIISIDHIRPLGLPLGLWGLGASLAAAALSMARKS